MSNKLSARFKSKNNESSLNRRALKFSAEPEVVEQKDEVKESSLENILNDFNSALLAKIDTTPVWFEYSAEKRQELIKTFVDNKISSENMDIPQIDRDVIIDALYASVSGFGAVQYLLDKDNVSAVIINGTNGIYIEIDGKVLNTETSLSEKQLTFLISSISSMAGGEISSGLCCFNIGRYSVKIAGERLCKSGINITIKKTEDFDISDLLKKEILNREIYDYIKGIVSDKKNIIISGSINSGKTLLLNVLLKNSLQNKRVYLVENTAEISADFQSLVKFTTDRNDSDYYNLIGYIKKSSPDYFAADLNYVSEEFCDASPKILTLRTPSADSALKSLLSSYINSDMPEKYAKLKLLSDFDYIIHMNKFADGSVKLESITELAPAKTYALSVKTIVKFVDGEYISSIPQPLTSLRAADID